MLEGGARRLRQTFDAIGTLRLLAVLAVIGPAAVLLGVTLQSRALLLENTEHRAARMADLLAQHASSTFDAYNFAFGRIEEYLRHSDDPAQEERLHGYLRDLDSQMRSSDGLMVLDGNWTISAHSRYFPAPKLDTRDREFVRLLRSQVARARSGRWAAGSARDCAGTRGPELGPECDAVGPGAGPEGQGHVSGKAGLAISLPFRSRLSGSTALVVSRALKDEAGNLDGGLVITLSQSFFQDSYRTVALAKGDRITLRRGDAGILAQFPPQPSALPGAPLPPGIDTAFPPPDRPVPLAEGTRDSVSAADGVRRIASLRKVEGYPIFVEVGFSVEAVLAPWYRQIPVNVLIAGLTGLTLLALTRVALAKSRAETRMQALVLVEARQRAAAEAALRQSQKMEALGQLTGGLAHDFNNLLNVVLINLELAAKWRSDGRSTKETKFGEYLRGAAQGAERGAALTRRLLDFARRRETETADVPVSGLVFGLLEMLGQAAGASVRITLDCPRGLPPARADANELETALLNLVVNARDAMPEGGRLHIAVRAEAVADDDSLALAPGGYLVLSARDTGCGMDAQMLARAAEPFFTTKEEGKGSGLGLAMVDRFAARAGGRLALASRPGGGTTAEIWLPAAPSPARASEGGTAADALEQALLQPARAMP